MACSSTNAVIMTNADYFTRSGEIGIVELPRRSDTAQIGSSIGRCFDSVG